MRWDAGTLDLEKLQERLDRANNIFMTIDDLYGIAFDDNSSKSLVH